MAEFDLSQAHRIGRNMPGNILYRVSWESQETRLAHRDRYRLVQVCTVCRDSRTLSLQIRVRALTQSQRNELQRLLVIIGLAGRFTRGVARFEVLAGRVFAQGVVGQAGVAGDFRDRHPVTQVPVSNNTYEYQVYHS